MERESIGRVPERDPSGVIGALAVACMAYPEQRVMQVIGNAFPGDPFYVEDADAIRVLHEYAEQAKEEP